MRLTTSTLTRRQSLAALAVLSTSPALAKKRKKPPVNADVSPFDDIADRLFAHLRESATYNGTEGALDGGPLARQMDDYSPSGEIATRKAFQDSRDLLARIRLSGTAMANYLPTVSAVLENGTRSAGIAYGRINPFAFTGHAPYIVSQISGPHIDSVNIMLEQQSLGSPKAVDAWIEKLEAFPVSFAGVVEKIRADKAIGCTPPAALIAKTLPVLDAFLAGRAADNPLAISLAARMKIAGLSKRMRVTSLKRALLLIDSNARPALHKLRTEMVGLLPGAREDAGIWALPQGEELYAANVRSLGDTDMSPDEIHRVGQDEIARIASAMNGLLEAQGLKLGSIGERMTALAEDPKNQFAATETGRNALLDYVRQKVRDAESHYASFLPAALIPRQALIVRRVPVATEGSAPGGFYDGPSLDGARPGTYWINLRDMNAVPRFRLPTLSYHEGVPGHHTQGAIAAALLDAPLLVRIASFNAYQEGWALYGEQFMAEQGVYADDPLGNLGRLQDELFRAVRLVVDTGLHHKRWTREQAIRTMRDVTGVAESRITAEVERYMAWPAQALGYKIGQIRLTEMRTRFLARKDGDIRAFHAAVLGGGAMPLDIVQGRMGID
jgi:uncharacterized protein (DUF885 family)